MSAGQDSLQYLKQLHYDTTLVLLGNNSGFLPLGPYKHLRQLNVVAGQGFAPSEIAECWSYYGETDLMVLSDRPDYREIVAFNDSAKEYDQVFIHLLPGDQPFTPQLLNLLEMALQRQKVVLVVYGDEDLLKLIVAKQSLGGLILAHSPTPEAIRAAVTAIFGGIPFMGKTKSGAGIATQKTRIRYGGSWASGIHPDRFSAIDSIVADGIAQRAFPGCQVLAIWKGNVIFERCYGNHTWETPDPVKPDDLYDLASLTKILSTTPALIQLHHQGVIDVDRKLGRYLSPAVGTDKEDLRIDDILAHRAKLQSWIPFYKPLMHDGIPDTLVFSTLMLFEYPLRVADRLYITRNYTDTMITQILRSPLLRKHSYLYSDLGMILLKYAIEEQTQTPLEEYIEKYIVDPLNLYTMGYRPLETFPPARIVPTEDDRYFRNSLLHGYVHDPAAAMFGGVAGHAGLFANARDVGVLMYTLSIGGTYGDTSVFNAEAIDHFNKKHFYKLRRGLGFDKPERVKGNKPNVTSYASDRSFGHSGFTGTFTWADPEHELVYVFLSNRVHPFGDNPLLTSLGIRAKIHAELYKAIGVKTED
jgi:CubicO group peptidase (beta-lactamase class C family)